MEFYSGLASSFVQFTRAWPDESVCAALLGSGGTGSQTHRALIATSTAHWNTCAALKISCSSRGPAGAGGCTRP